MNKDPNKHWQLCLAAYLQSDIIKCKWYDINYIYVLCKIDVIAKKTKW